jgi:hypothetical protein
LLGNGCQQCQRSHGDSRQKIEKQQSDKAYEATYISNDLAVQGDCTFLAGASAMGANTVL